MRVAFLILIFVAPSTTTRAFAPPPLVVRSTTTTKATPGLCSTAKRSTFSPAVADSRSNINIDATDGHDNNDTNYVEETTTRGGISLDLAELGARLGGIGRARICWDLYSIGVDPANCFGRTANDDNVDTNQEEINGVDEENFETISPLLPSNRRSQMLGRESLDLLADLYSKYPNSAGVGQLEGGVASLANISTSSDGTTKLLLRLADGLEVETVIIPWEGVRSTVCISSQVGCAQGCRFCATGRMGKLRSLTSDEILAQMFFAKKICRLNNIPEINNVVFMGLGEPSDNAANVVIATKILTTRGLFQLSATKVTVSTVAPNPDSFYQFVDAPCVLAWSVHAVDDKLRKQLVPTTRYSMRELREGLIETLKHRPKSLRTTMLEVVLLDGVNDSLGHADELAEFAQVIINSVPDCKLVINIIPYNDIGGGSSFRKPSKESSLAFQQHLQRRHGLYAFVRVTRGDDESAACGQLVTKSRRAAAAAAATKH